MENEWVYTLRDELNEMDIMHDKIKNEESWLEFKQSDECEDCDDEEDFDVEEEE
jgi:hypothetical protein